MVPVVHGICHMDSAEVVVIASVFILLLSLPLFFSITGGAEVVVKLILRSEPLHVLIVHEKVFQFTLCKKSFPVFLC
jgi:Flp pilus assembly protein protease CpaA